MAAVTQMILRAVVCRALQEKLVLVLRLLEGGKPLSDWATAIRSRV